MQVRVRLLTAPCWCRYSPLPVTAASRHSQLWFRDLDFFIQLLLCTFVLHNNHLGGLFRIYFNFSCVLCGSLEKKCLGDVETRCQSNTSSPSLCRRVKIIFLSTGAVPKLFWNFISVFADGNIINRECRPGSFSLKMWEIAIKLATQVIQLPAEPVLVDYYGGFHHWYCLKHVDVGDLWSPYIGLQS